MADLYDRFLLSSSTPRPIFTTPLWKWHVAWGQEHGITCRMYRAGCWANFTSTTHAPRARLRAVLYTKCSFCIIVTISYHILDNYSESVCCTRMVEHVMYHRHVPRVDMWTAWTVWRGGLSKYGTSSVYAASDNGADFLVWYWNTDHKCGIQTQTVDVLTSFPPPTMSTCKGSIMISWGASTLSTFTRDVTYNDIMLEEKTGASTKL